MINGVILCVDDEETILDSLEMELGEAFGEEFIIELALGANDANAILEGYTEGDKEVLVIISDFLMPLVKGDEFLINAHRKFPKIVKIMLSGQADPCAIEKTREHADLYRFISKPWDKDELKNAITDGIKEKIGGR